jgi:glycosyltransferase involved in cell wall biosynthesis
MAEGLIIIPAHNEGQNIGKVLDDISGLQLGLDLVVINDGSKDNTAAIAMSRGVPVISHPFNLGYGGALQTGFKYAVRNDYCYIIQFDGDGQHNASNLKDMAAALELHDADIVIGSRFVAGGSFETSFVKKLVIKFLSAIIRMTTKKTVTDPTSGFKGYRKNVFTYFSKFNNFPDDYPDADILIKMLKMDFTLKEIPIHVNQREFGTSMHAGLKPIVYLLQILISIVMITIRNEQKTEFHF